MPDQRARPYFGHPYALVTIAKVVTGSVSPTFGKVRGYFLGSNGARGGTRTHKSVRTARFKRAASASCATRALLSRYLAATP